MLTSLKIFHEIKCIPNFTKNEVKFVNLTCIYSI